MSRHFVVDDGVTKARYGLILCKFTSPDGRAETLRVVGMWDELETAKDEARKRFAEFNPGMAMIQDTTSGEVLQAHNWSHDRLIWSTYSK